MADKKIRYSIAYGAKDLRELDKYFNWVDHSITKVIGKLLSIDYDIFVTDMNLMIQDNE